MSVIVKFVLIVAIYQLIESAKVIPSSVVVTVGQSFLLYLEPDVPVMPRKCYAISGDAVYLLDFEQVALGDRLNGTSKTGITDNVMWSLGENKCGFKMDNVTKETAYDWEIWMHAEDGKNYTATAKVVWKAYDTQNTTLEYRVGDSFMVNCASQNKDIDFCRLYDSQGQLVLQGKEDCFMSTPTTKLSDFGRWRCELSYKSSLESIVKYFNVIKIPDEKVVTWFNETEEYYYLGCKVQSYTVALDYCVFVRPDGFHVKLRPGLATKRYVNLGTPSDKAICNLRITKPLLDTEKGIWRCEQRSYSTTGGFITTSNLKSLPSPELPRDIYIHNGSKLLLTCSISRSAPYCYMRAPNGTIYPMKDERMVHLGRCILDKVSELSDTGTWFCGFGKETGEPDEIYKFQVNVLEAMIVIPTSVSVNAQLDSSAELMCSTKGVGDYPLKYCRFLSPDGVMYQIGNKEQSKRLSYAGQGFEYGDCGLTIHSVEKRDEGTWSCMTRIGMDYRSQEIYANVHLAIAERGTSLASVLGISFGVVVVVFVLGIILVNRYKRPNRGTNNMPIFFRRNVKLRRSDTSGSSNESVTVGDFTQQTTAL